MYECEIFVSKKKKKVGVWYSQACNHNLKVLIDLKLQETVFRTGKDGRLQQTYLFRCKTLSEERKHFLWHLFQCIPTAESKFLDRIDVKHPIQLSL